MNISDKNQPKQELYMVNARRLLCPMPIIRTQDAIKDLSPNDLLQVICTDPGTLHDIPSWCRINGHHIEDISEVKNDGMDEIIFIIKVGD